MKIKNNLMYLSSLFLLLISLPLFLGGQEILTFEKCIEIAIENNPQIKIARKKIEEANLKKKEAFGNYLPNITLSGSYTKMSEPPSIPWAVPVITPVMVNDLLTGKPVAGLLTTGYLESEMSMGQEENYTYKLSLVQPLFTWGKIYHGNRQAKLGYNLAEYEYLKVKNEVILNVKKSFFSVIVASEFNKIAEEAVEVMQKHYDVIKTFYNKGMVSNVDVSRVKVQLVNAQTRKIKAENGYTLAKKSLLNLLNIEPADENSYLIKGELKYQPKKYELEELFNLALQNRIEIKQIEIQKEMIKSFLKITKAKIRPNLSFIANYQYQKPYYFTNDWTENWNAIVALDFPLFDGFINTAKVKQIKSQISQIEISYDQLTRVIKLEVEKSYLDLIEAEDRIRAQETNVKLAKENLNAMQKRYEKGLVSDMELRDTQLALTQAETEYSQALYDYNVALACLEKAVGK